MHYKGYEIVLVQGSKHEYCIKKNGKIVIESATLAGAKLWVDKQ